jgi:hypothetical protein
MELLEAQSDDGLVTWNFLDATIDDLMKRTPRGAMFPVVRAMRPIAFPTRIIQ